MSQRMIALAGVGWSTFLFLLAMEWGRLLLIEQVWPRTNPWHVAALGLCYYGLTAYQAAHVLTGLIWLALAARRPQSARLAALSLYADFTNALFIALAFLLIFPSMDLSGF